MPELRLATVDDAEAMRNIYNKEVLGSTVTFDLVPRSLEDQKTWIIEHSGVYPAIVCCEQAQVIGFASLSPYRNRPAYSTTVENSLYVHHLHRRKGIGRLLLNETIILATEYGFHSIMARISGGHQASIALHKSCGFELVGIEKEVGRKFGHWLDVALMQKLL